LYNSGPDGARMTDLARSIMFSPAGLSHLVTRMERDRLVARRTDDADRRSIKVTLTPEGRSVLARARRTHNDVVRDAFSKPLGRDRLRQLAAAWSALQAR
jgi:DNA-binding MarR family transcriptional regulator